MPARLFICLLAAVVLTACQSGPMDRIDTDATRLIEDFQGAALRQPGATDPNVVPPGDTTIDRPEGVYDRRPMTVNPTADQLDVDTAEELVTLVDDSDLVAGLDADPNDPDTVRLEMDLEQVLQFAIEYSPEYRNQKEELFLSSLSLLIERHRWGPRFFNDVTARIAGTPERGDHNQAASLINDFRVSQRLPYGGEVAVNALVDFVNNLRSEAADTQSAELRFSITLPLLRGAGMAAREDLIQAERNLVYAARRFERFRREFLVDIATNYFDLLQQQQELENRRRQLENFTALVERTEALADAGRQPYFEVQRAQQQQLFAQNNLINARQRYALSLDNFKLRLGMETDEQIAVKPLEIVVPNILLEPQTAQRAALMYRLDLQIQRDQIDDANRRVLVARNNLLPDLNLRSNLALRTDADEDMGGVDFNLGDSSYSAELTLGIPLDRRTEQLDVRRALVQMERSRRTYTLSRNRIVLTVRDSIRRIRQAQFTLELQEQNIAIADMRLRGVLLRERSLGPRDFIEAQEDLLNARNSYDQALRDLRVSNLQFLRDTGQLRVTETGQWLPPARVVAAIERMSREPIDDESPQADDLTPMDMEDVPHEGNNQLSPDADPDAMP